jgi:hypothetical protein
MTDVAKATAATRTAVPGKCPACGAEHLARYEVLSAGGWYQVLKCQTCLTSVERTPWQRLGHVNRDQATNVIAQTKGTRGE